jgi:hypothetical protein
MGLFDTTYDFSSLNPSAANEQAVKDAFAAASQSNSNSSNKSVANNSEIEDTKKQIAALKDAMKEASGYKLKELKQQLEISENELANKLQTAQIAADASKYGSDKSLEGTKYASDRSLEGTKYASNNSLQGTKYSADSSAASSRYGTDADLYKFGQQQVIDRGKQALDFLSQYENLASHPDSFLQASNYARLGYQTEGMPGMMSDLLGNVNPNGAPVGNVAFRVGQGPMPQNAAMAIFGANPLNLGTRNPGDIAAPVWYGPQGSGSTVGMMSPVFATNSSYVTAPQGEAHRGDLVSSYGTSADFLPAVTRQYASDAATYDGASGAVPQGNQYVTMGADGVPRIMTGQGLVPTDTSSEDAFKAGVAQLMQQGAHRIAPQGLERMTQTERDMLASGIKDAGGVPADFFEAYARSRMGNEGAGSAL